MMAYLSIPLRLLLIFYAYISSSAVEEQKAGLIRDPDQRELSDSTMKNLNLNKHPRYAMMNFSKHNANKSHELLVFLAITSAADHTHLREAGRATWLIPCIASSYCDYRFFIDAPSSKITLALSLESESHRDIVLRNDCSLMKRHHDDINYGNSPPTRENSVDFGHTPTLAEQLNRLNYKIDWKVCFCRFMDREQRVAVFNVFVEDDSFACIENLLYQAAILKNISQAIQTKIPEFRTGTPLYDGFDDSSTIMSAGIVTHFARFYPSLGLSCEHVFDEIVNHSKPLSSYEWLSWGNSWRQSHCDWKRLFRDNFNITIISPTITCMTAVAHLTSHHQHIGNISGEADVKQYQTPSLRFPCKAFPLVYHHPMAGEVLLRNDTSAQQPTAKICENMLLIDKVKERRGMHELWNAAIDDQYFNFSKIWLHEGDEGWKILLEDFQLHNQSIDISNRRSLFVDENRAKRFQQLILASIDASPIMR
jgi:hypothetical protein